MNYFSTKFKIVTAAILFVLSPYVVFAQAGSQTCSENGYTIATINGIHTDEDGAILNRDSLKRRLLSTYNNQPLAIDFLLNPSHLGGAGDILKAIQQGFFDSETVRDYDLIEMLQDASEKVATQKLLLVAHSQGNFYANSFYDTVVDKAGGAPAESIGVYSVATPSARVAGGGKWLTSNTDKAIAGIVGHIPFRKIMEPNTHIELQNGDDFWGHNFADIYLKYQSEKIISDIHSSLDRLKTNNIQDTQKPCLASPEFSIAHKIQGNAFAAADLVASTASFVAFKLPVAIGQYAEKATISVAKAVISTTTKVIKTGVEKVVEVAQIIKETFSEVFQKDNFQLAQIVDLSEAQSNQSGQSVQLANFKQCSFDAQKSASSLKLIINEVAWMGGTNNADDEWIELKNISDSAVDISGYQILDKAEQIKIVFDKNTIIPAGGFFLLERKGDETVSSVKADLIYNGALSNADEGLKLFDGECGLIDEVLVSSKWLAGDNIAKKTMERNNSDLNWHTSAVIGGTPKKENSQPAFAKKQETAINILEETEEDEPQKLNQETSASIIQSQFSISSQNQISSDNIVSQTCGFVNNQISGRQGIIINEVAWMGTINSANDEWIELKNISGSEINLSGWQLIDQGEQIKITFENNDKIPAGGFFLLERTDDNSAPNIIADKIYTGALSNTNEGLRLFNNNCSLIDEVSANPDWPAGDNVQRRSMERSPDLSWHNYNGIAQNNILGTPKAENSVPTNIFSGNEGGSGSATSDQQSVVINFQQQTAKILINEIQAYPTGERFIELYNPNSSAVNLTDWYIQRKTQTGSSFGSLVSKTYFENKIIDAYGYFLISRTSLENADIILDNLTITESNTIQIKNSNGEIIDKIGWGDSSDCENNCASEPLINQSVQRKSPDNIFIDTDNNADDFEIQTCSSPKTKIGNCSTANQAPSAFFVYTPQNPNVGDLITFDAASSTDLDGTISLFQWDFGDNATSTISTATTTHFYSQPGSYQVGLIVFDDQNASSTTASITISVSSLPSSGVNHLVISEIMAGRANNADNEFVELYNPTDNAIDLTGWDLKKKSNSGALYNLAVNFASSTQSISPKSFFLIASQQYSGSQTPDSVYTQASNHLAGKENTVVLADQNGEVVDEIYYSEITDDQSLERKAFSEGVCVSAQNEGEFLGNDCDTDSDSDFSVGDGSASDWEIRQIPNPQNSLNFPEPRDAPIAPENFSIQRSSGTMKLIFNWDASRDYSGAASTLTYKIIDISDSSSTLAAVETTLVEALISINERERSYIFSIQAFDKEGLGSLKSEARIDVPAVKQTILAQQLGDADEAFAELGIIQKLSLNPSEFQGSFNRIELKVFSEDGHDYMHSVWIKEIDPDSIPEYNLLFYTNYADLGLPKQWNTMVYDVGNITTKSDKIYEFAVRGRYGGFGGPGSQSNLKVKGSSNPDSYPYGDTDGTRIADLYFRIYLEE